MRLYFVSPLWISSFLADLTLRQYCPPVQFASSQVRQALISSGPSECRILTVPFRASLGASFQGLEAAVWTKIPFTLTLIFPSHPPLSRSIPRRPGATWAGVVFGTLFHHRHIPLQPTSPAQPPHSTRRGIPARRRAKLTLSFRVLARTAFL